MRWRPLLSCLLLLAPCAHAGRTVHLATTEYPPYFSASLPGDGALAALTRQALALHGHQLVLHYRPWARVMAEVQQDHFDGVLAVWYEPARSRYLHYSLPLASTIMGFYGLVDKPLQTVPLSRLKPYTIGTGRDYTNPEAFERAGLNTVVATDDLTNLRKLAAGRIDLVLIDKAAAAQLVQRLPPALRARIAWQEPPVADMPLHVGLRKNLPDGLQLLDDLNNGLRTLQQSGQRAALLKHYQLAQ